MNFFDKTPERDWLVYSNALVLAARIRDYWAKRGKKVETWIERQGDTDAFGVRSSLVNGLPPR